MSLIDQIKSKLKSFSSNRAKQDFSGEPVALDAEMAEMGFLEHLEDLRWAILKGLGGVLAAMVTAVFFRGWIIEELKTKRDFLFMALHLITKTDPSPPSAKGKPHEIIEAWLQWAERENIKAE